MEVYISIVQDLFEKERNQFFIEKGLPVKPQVSCENLKDFV